MKLEHLYTSDQKIKWFGYGEWVEEPDYAEFEWYGIKCTVNRMISYEGPYNEYVFGGFLCGYIRLPNDFEYDGDIYYFEFENSPPGGITYKRKEIDGIWIGFDCSHFGDYVPSIEFFLKNDEEAQKRKRKLESGKFEYLNIKQMLYPSYKNFNFVVEETKNLAKEIYNYNTKLKDLNEKNK